MSLGDGERLCAACAARAYIFAILPIVLLILPIVRISG